VVLRTLSKAFALAGARCGCLVGDPRWWSCWVVDSTVRTALAQYRGRVVSTADAATHHDARALQVILSERERLYTALTTLPRVRQVWPSTANFLLVDCVDAERCLRDAIEAGLLVRDMRRQPAWARRCASASAVRNKTTACCKPGDDMSTREKSCSSTATAP